MTSRTQNSTPAMSISRGFERKSIRNSIKTDDDSTIVGSPKSSITNASTALSLGAKIATKAKENYNNSNYVEPKSPTNKPVLSRRSSGNALMPNNLQNGKNNK